MKALAVIGYHHTGKTTLVTALVKALTARGFSCATIKDIHSEAFRADTPGKNSALHIEAGAVSTFARGLHDTAMIFPKPLDLPEMLRLIEADYLIIEGMKNAAVPKLVCAESMSQLDELVDDTCIGISGLIAATAKSYKDLKVYCLQDDLDDLVNHLLATTFEILPMADPECCSACGMTCNQMAGEIVQGRKTRQDCVLDADKKVILTANGKEIVIVPFVQELLRDVLQALVKNLKGVDPNAEINLTLKP